MSPWLTWRASDILPNGFGTSSRGSNYLYGGTTTTAGALLVLIIMANSFQVGLSVLYFATNGFMTAVCVQSEWSSYASNRKGLRVSANKSHAQRSTYFLQLPYRYSLPLLVTFGVLHWLVSQSVFLLDEVWNSPLADEATSGTSLGFSPLAILIGLALLTCLWLLIIIQGLWTTQIEMPLLRSCSAVIAAACQPSGARTADVGDDTEVEGNTVADEAHLKQVQWGSICEPLPLQSSNAGIGHCAFSAGYVGLPVDGRMYAG